MTQPPEYDPHRHLSYDMGVAMRSFGKGLGAIGTAISASGIPDASQIGIVVSGIGQALSNIGGAVAGEAGAPAPGMPGYQPPNQAAFDMVAKSAANLIGQALIARAIPLSTFIAVMEDFAAVLLRSIPETVAERALMMALVEAFLLAGAIYGASIVGGEMLGWLKALFDFSFGAVDPLVLDLDGNGVQMLGVNDTNIHFDLDQNGFAEQVGWLSAGDGFLVRDLNDNGLVDDGSEMIGNSTQMGFAVLAGWDANNDGVIDAADAIFSDLRVWRDLNLDGVTQAGELGTLPSFGVISIAVASTAQGWWVQNAGNTILAEGSYTSISGNHDALAVNLDADLSDTQFVLPEGFMLDPAVFLLPNLHGYGTVPDLWVAMTLDPTLLAMVQDLVADADDFTSIENITGGPFALLLGGQMYYGYAFDAFEPILARWAGVDNSGEQRVQAENTAEAFMGKQADHALNNPYFYEAFQEFATQLAVRFYAQVPQLEGIAIINELVEAIMNAVPADGIELTPEEIETISAPYLTALDGWNTDNENLEPFSHLRYDFETDSIEGDIDGFVDHLLDDYDFDDSDPWDGYDGWYAGHVRVLTVVDPEGAHLRDRHRAYTDNIDLAILRLPHETEHGTSGADVLEGDAFSLPSRDLLIGGAGDDSLNGGLGDDTYLFDGGSGHDVVADDGGKDEVAFQGPYLRTIAQFSFANSGSEDLLISFEGRSETVEITGYFKENGAATIETLSFVDGIVSERGVRDGVIASQATSGADSLFGFSLATTLAGLAGNDTLIGRHGDDILEGGLGNDILSGSGGNDLYFFAIGDGADIIREDSSVWNGRGGFDTIEFGAGIYPSDVTVSQANFGTHLVLTFGDDGDSITIENCVNDFYNRIELVRFADTTTWTFAELMLMALAPTAGSDVFWGGYDVDVISGGAGDDVIDGRGGADILIGGTGNDLLSGSGGHDIYRFSLGDGQDIVREDVSAFSGVGGYDIIAFQEGIDPGDIIVTQASFGRDLVLSIAGTTDSITIYATVTDLYNRVEQVRFADDTEWTHAQLMAMALTPTSGADTFYGSYDGETIGGGGGADVIDARGGNDILIGGAGNDMLSGSGGDDVYRFSAGDGQDVVRDDINAGSGVGGFDTVYLDGIAPGDVIVSQVSSGSNILITFVGNSDSITLYGTINDLYQRIEQVVFSGGTVWTHADLMTKATAPTSGADTLYGSYDGETIEGAAGNDVIDARGGNDILVGGLGNDVLSGSGGNDTYMFALGDGQDIVRENLSAGSGLGGFDIISLGAGIAPGDVVVTKADGGNDLVLTISGTSDTITIDDGVTDGYAFVEEVHFADGTIWTRSEMLARSIGATSNADTLYGDSGANVIGGLGGNDTLSGRAGNDVLVGGLGNDTLIGEGGDDTYQFALGDGQDVVRDYGEGWGGYGGADTVEFAAGIAPGDVTVTQTNGGNDLVLAIAGTTDQITLLNTASDGNFRIERVVFADATVWTHADLMARALAPTSANSTYYGGYDDDTISGGAGNDTLDGRRGNDILIGGAGNDTLIGTDGNDTYRFGLGDGQDVATEYGDWWNGAAGTDKVELGAGITTADVAVSQANAGSDLVLTLTDGSTLRLVNTVNDGDRRIEQVVFADATVWTHADLMARATAPTSGNDVFYGGYDNDTISGGAGNDTLDGRRGNDILIGGAGNDTLIGTDGNDTYRFGLGDGQDVATEYGDWWNGAAGTDKVELGAGITTADVAVSQANAGSDLVLTLTDGSTLRLVNTVNDGDRRIEQVVFADATVWTHADLMARATAPTSGNDVFYGDYGGNTISGGAGNDTLDGRRGNDILIGGTGNDILIGSEGNDTYRFGLGDGQDNVREYGDWWNGSGGTDVIELGAGITAADVTVGTADGGTSYVLYIGGGDDRITITGGATWGSDWAIETILFADSSTWTGASLAGRVAGATTGADTLYGTASADVLRGLAGNDAISGGGGADTLYGDAGNDTLTGDGFSQTGSNLLVNGSFETSGTITGSGGWGKANSDLPGWTKTNSQPFEQVSSGHAGIYATDGSYWFDTDSAGGSGSNMDISQTIADLDAGAVMILKFDHANTTSMESGTFEVYWNGVLVATIAETGTTMRLKTFELVAVEGDNVLGFRGTGSAENSGSAIDNVRLYATDGMSGDDSLFGGDGDDILIGGGGADLMTGGAGADTFRLGTGDSGTGSAADRIADFLSGTDKIDLSGIDADSGTGGNQAFSFIGTDAFSAVAGEVRYTFNGTDTLVKADMDGDGAADLVIILSGAVTPLGSDFVL